MRIAILGAGSIGTLFGIYLYKGGNEVTLYNRNRKIIRSITERGVRLRTPNGTIAAQMPISRPPRTLRGHDLSIVTVKAYDTIEIARRYRGRIGNGIVLSLQNGLGNYEILSKYLGRGHVLVGSTTEAALAMEPGVIAHTGRGKTWIGEYQKAPSQQTRAIVALLKRAGLKSGASSSIADVLWTKAIVNSAINPISALSGLPNGSLLVFRGLMDQIIEEGVRVGKAERLRIESSSIKRLTWKILRETGANRSSMLQDIDRGRRTEIRELTGVIVTRGRRHRIPTPLNELVLHLVQSLERRNTIRHDSGSGVTSTSQFVAV